MLKSFCHMVTKDIGSFTRAKLKDILAHYRLQINPASAKPLLVSQVVSTMVEKGLLGGDEAEEQEEEDATNKLSSDQYLQLQKLKLDTQVRQAAIKAEIDREIALRELNSKYNQGGQMSDNSNKKFDVYAAQKSSPKFDEKNVEKYFLNFEKTAQMLSWPKQYWTVISQSQLKGKASSAYSSLSVGMLQDDETIKATVLQAYALIPETYRQNFRKKEKESERNLC